MPIRPTPAEAAESAAWRLATGRRDGRVEPPPPFPPSPLDVPHGIRDADGRKVSPPSTLPPLPPQVAHSHEPAEGPSPFTKSPRVGHVLHVCARALVCGHMGVRACVCACVNLLVVVRAGVCRPRRRSAAAIAAAAAEHRFRGGRQAASRPCRIAAHSHARETPHTRTRH